jgi:uncharacterized protein (TIGR00297 family)
MLASQLAAPVHGANVCLTAFAGSFAAATADTWATEIGTLARATPRSIVTLRPIASGLSGGITIPGTIAQLSGAAFIAAVAAFLGFGGAIAVLAGGISGSTIDSVLGATLQDLRWCPRCERSCETDPHVCGERTCARRGLRWFSNDAVNFAATASGAIIAALISVR